MLVYSVVFTHHHQLFPYFCIRMVEALPIKISKWPKEGHIADGEGHARAPILDYQLFLGVRLATVFPLRHIMLMCWLISEPIYLK